MTSATYLDGSLVIAAQHDRLKFGIIRVKRNFRVLPGFIYRLNLLTLVRENSQLRAQTTPASKTSGMDYSLSERKMTNVNRNFEIPIYIRETPIGIPHFPIGICRFPIGISDFRLGNAILQLEFRISDRKKRNANENLSFSNRKK